MKDVIPSNPTRRKILGYDKKLYRHRYLVEIFFHTLKSFRRIATRYEKTARNYLAIVHLACAHQRQARRAAGQGWLRRDVRRRSTSCHRVGEDGLCPAEPIVGGFGRGRVGPPPFPSHHQRVDASRSPSPSWTRPRGR